MNRALLAILPLGFAVVLTACGAVQPTDPLPSWSEGETNPSLPPTPIKTVGYNFQSSLMALQTFLL